VVPARRSLASVIAPPVSPRSGGIASRQGNLAAESVPLMIGGGSLSALLTRLGGGAVPVEVFRGAAVCSLAGIPRLTMVVILLEDCQFVKFVYCVPRSMYSATQMHHRYLRRSSQVRR
jgi:hypothetical protein